MTPDINNIKNDISSFSLESTEALEIFRIKYIGSKGLIKALFKEMKNVAPEERRTFGQKLNELKQLAETRLEEGRSSFTKQNKSNTENSFDITRPADDISIGSRHPVSLVMNQMIEIFRTIGFSISEGPEIEDDWHNFSALNIPQDHPARDMQDTFFLSKDPDTVLRTHTSSVQVRVMENSKPPIRTISPGRVYRNETISARAHCIFHQVEGLFIDTSVSFADLKQTLYYFAQKMFGKDTKIRFRPSYFPFTEPSAEMDISCFFCKSEGCNICKHTGWVEIGGCGMVDPNVLEKCKIDPEKYTGFAFGMGVERIAMLKYKINDIRLFFDNDIRFLKQFSSII